MENLGEIAAALALVGTILNWVVITPSKQQYASFAEASKLQYEKLQQSLDNLTKSTDRLNELLDDTKKDVNDLRERLAKAEASCSSAHKRIDGLEKK